MLFYRISHNKFNVRKIIEFNKLKRMFCVFEKDKPYELNLIYEEPHMINDYTPIFGLAGAPSARSSFQEHVQCMFHTRYSHTMEYTTRMTESECDKEIKKIEKLKKIIELEEDKKEQVLLEKYKTNLRFL